ncbi:Dihydropteroate synthase-like protein [Mycena rebaudengoi]|nr:Dihydropteroate synthase-like protein [Mycena rebaudengoi]
MLREPLSPSRDTIRVNELLLTIPLLTGAIWPKPFDQATPQPVLVSLTVPHDISQTASTDDLSHTINYSSLCSLLRDSLNERTLPLESLESLSAAIYDILLLRSATSKHGPSLGQVRLRVRQSRGPLNCKSIGVDSVATASSGSSWNAAHVQQFCEDLQCSTIIGVNACEREEKQNVHVNLIVTRPEGDLGRENWLDFRAVVRTLHKHIEKTSYQTLEALASYVAEVTLRHLRLPPLRALAAPTVTVKASKPSAIVFASSAEVEIHRTYADYPHIFASHPGDARLKVSAPDISTHTVALALGSNLGDRFYNIELALRLLETPQPFLSSEDAHVTVTNTSFMYESAPMYITDQPSFINCACVIETNLAPFQLLKLLKTIETTVGRVPSIRNGPRAVDLDIILYDDAVIDTRTGAQKDADDLEGELVIPHPRLMEREFVLRPLSDMIPEFLHPLVHKSIATILAALVHLDTPPMQKVMPFPQCPLPSNYVFPHTTIDIVPPTLTHWTFSDPSPSKKMRHSHQTRIMATLNATPDSFSDGATHNTLPSALEYARDAVASAASILDVGGYSTRPGAAYVSAAEETARVTPYISAIRSAHPELPISVDTFRPEVARAAIAAGANCINDVYAFSGADSYPFALEQSEQETCMHEMKRVAREFAVPVALMHSRGDAGANKDYGAYAYAGAGQAVVESVRLELGAKVDMIVKGKGGIRRWLVIVDPGIGFSKTLDGNLEVLRDAAAITANVQIGHGSRRRHNALAGYPQLIGPSRKSFLRTILEKAPAGRKTEAKERGWATAAAVACAVQQGALVVRVHDTREMTDVVSVANALW